MSTLINWQEPDTVSIEYHNNPFLGLHREVDQALREYYDLFSSKQLNSDEYENLILFPALDIVEDENKLSIQIEMPGLDENDIHVAISNNTLTILGEKSISIKNKKYISREIRYGHYERVIALPSDLDTDKTTASFKRGILWLVVPKKTRNKIKRVIKVDQAE